MHILKDASCSFAWCVLFCRHLSVRGFTQKLKTLREAAAASDGNTEPPIVVLFNGGEGVLMCVPSTIAHACTYFLSSHIRVQV